MEIDDINNHKLIATDFQISNMEKLATAMTQLEDAFGSSFLVTSGLRNKELQERINPSVKNSAHLSGEAVDISSPDRVIWCWMMDNIPLLEESGVYLEDRSRTPRWIHCQIRVPNSKSRVFIP